MTTGTLSLTREAGSPAPTRRRNSRKINPGAKRRRSLARSLVLYHRARLDAAEMIRTAGGSAEAYTAWVRADPDAALAAAREANRIERRPFAG